MRRDEQACAAPRPPAVMLDIGITGHRSRHPVYSANRAAIAACLGELVAALGSAARAAIPANDEKDTPAARLHSLLAYGADLMAVHAAHAQGWPVVAPLPFGRALNLAINAQPSDLADMEALVAGADPADADTAARAADIAASADRVALFELADEDEKVDALFRAHLADPSDSAAQLSFATLCSDRAAMAARVMIDHVDLLIGIWDGETRGTIGGTRHSIEAALGQGVPVLWIDARDPQGWHILRAEEELANLPRCAAATRETAAVAALVRDALVPAGEDGQSGLGRERWRARSHPLLTSYRRVEALFGDAKFRPLRRLRRASEHPDAIAQGSGRALLAAAAALPGGDRGMAERIAADVLRPFAWADGVSTALSDAYRGGMVASFFLSAFAIIGGLAYLPLGASAHKWAFALFEFLLLAAIVGIFFTGKRRRWHERWFATRRVAEYFRHAPILLLLGAARATGRWPRGGAGNGPEMTVRRALRSIGLPRMAVTAPYLRGALELMRDQHVVPQRDYHRAKAERLHRAHHNLHRLSELLFILAVVSVAAYLSLEAGAALGWLVADAPDRATKIFTFLGVLFPTLGASLAGVHYFGDFDRFASISDVTAQKLGDVAARIALLLDAPDHALTYASVLGLAHAIDDIVVAEIENWQAVFGGKHITVPV
jgi:hypothetical protein